MAINLGDLYVQLSAETSGLKEGSKEAQRLAKQIEKIELNLVRHQIKAGKMKIAEEARVTAERVAEARRLEREMEQLELNLVRHQIAAGKLKLAEEEAIRNARIQQAIETNRKLTAEQDRVTKSARDSAAVFEAAFNKKSSIEMLMASLTSLRDKIQNSIGYRVMSGVANGFLLAFKKMTGAVRSVFNHIFSLKGLLVGGGALWGIKSIIDVSAAFEGLQATMKAVTNTTEEAAEEFNFLKRQSLRLGLDIQTLKKQYVDLKAATNGMNVSGKEVKKIFLSIAEAARVLQLDDAKLQGAFYAIQQMFSKGKVQAEEIRKQLGNVIPSAVPMMARAYAASIGKTFLSMEEKAAMFEKALKQGLVRTVKVMPFFADEIQRSFGGGLDLAIQKANAQFTNLRTQIKLLQDAIGRAGLLDSFAKLAIEIKNYLAPITDIINQIGPQLKELFPKFDKKSADQYFNSAKEIVASIIKSIRAIVPVFYSILNAVNAVAAGIANLFDPPEVQKYKQEVVKLKKELRDVSLLNFKSDVGFSDTMDQRKAIKDKIDELNKLIEEAKANRKPFEPIVLTPPEEIDAKFQAIIDEVKSANIQIRKEVEKSSDFGTAMYKWELGEPSKAVAKLTDKLSDVRQKADDAAMSLNLFAQGGTAALDKLKDSAQIDEMFSKLDTNNLQADIIKIADAIGYQLPRSFTDAKYPMLDMIIILQDLKAHIAETLQSARSSEIALNINKELSQTQDTLSAIGNLTASQKFFGLFDPSIVDNAVQTNMQIEAMSRNIKELRPDGVQSVAESIKKIEKASGKNFLEGIDLSKVMAGNAEETKKFAKAAVEAKNAGETMQTSWSKIGSAMSSIAGQMASLFSQLTNMYEQQASYHAQMAQEALNNGRTQAETWMQLADAVHYSNNEQAKSFEAKAIASAEAAAMQYQEEQKLRAKANANAKKAFENQKKLQIAQAMMATATAMISALSPPPLGLGPVFGPIVATAAGALGAAQVGIISQQQYTPREKGGPITGGKPYLVGEAGPELIIPGKGGSVVNNDDLMDGIGGGSTTVVFNIQAHDASGFDRLLSSRRGMIINMIKEANNSKLQRSPV